MMPVYKPPNGVRTPDELLTAPRDSDPVPGKPCTNEFTIFDIPIANNSCVASTDFPFATLKFYVLIKCPILGTLENQVEK